MNPVKWVGRNGRRGSVLTLLGVVWVLTGVSTLFAPPSPEYWLLSGGSELRALGWILTGCVAIFYAHRAQGDDAWGYFALYIGPCFRIAAYGLGFFQWAAGSDYGTPRGIFGVLSWAAIVALLVIVAGWPEDSRRTDGGDSS